MTIKSIDEMKSKPIEIDLTGPDGNAFVLISKARKFSKIMDVDGEDVINEMTSGDYDTLIKVFEKYFGSFVTLYK